MILELNWDNSEPGQKKYYNLVQLPHMMSMESNFSLFDTSGPVSHKMRIKATGKMLFNSEAPIEKFIDILYLRSWGYTLPYQKKEDRGPRRALEWVF